jgi:hypothetical protein
MSDLSQFTVCAVMMLCFQETFLRADFSLFSRRLFRTDVLNALFRTCCSNELTDGSAVSVFPHLDTLHTFPFRQAYLQAKYNLRKGFKVHYFLAQIKHDRQAKGYLNARFKNREEKMEHILMYLFTVTLTTLTW